jgi:hypothetical protein
VRGEYLVFMVWGVFPMGKFSGRLGFGGRETVPYGAGFALN